MFGSVIGIGILAYLVLYLSGAATRVNEAVGTAVRQIPNAVPDLRKCFSWITWERVLFCLRLVLWLAYMCTIMAVLCLVYWTISSEGLRRGFPDLSMKLWKMPFLADLRSFRETRDLDLAHVVAVMLMLCSLYSLHELAKMQLGMDTLLKRHTRNLETYERLVRTIGVTILTIDLALFYLAVTEASWGSIFDFKAFLVSLGYVCVLIILTLVSILLEPFGKRSDSDATNLDDAAVGSDDGALISEPQSERLHARS